MDKKTLIYIILLFASFYFVQLFFSPPPAHKKIEQQPIVKTEKKTKNENFYVLENEYQQLVFSDIGGSLVEINLPLKTPQNQSIINATEFDKKIIKDSYQNSFFPQNSYFKPGFIHSKNSSGGYYPLLRRSIYDKDNNLLHYISPKYYCLNLISKDSKISKTKYKVTRFEKNLIEFESTDSNIKIIKTFSFARDVPYTFNLKIKIINNKNLLWISSGIPEVEISSNMSMNILKYRNSSDVVHNISLPKTETKNNNYVDWISNSNGFFGIIIDPLNEIKSGYKTKFVAGDKAPSRITLIDKKYDVYPPKKYPGYETYLPLLKGEESINFRIFAGPYQDHILKAIDDIYSEPFKGYDPNYIKVKSIKGWFSFASEPFSKFLLLIMRLFYSITHSWGLSIILLTIVFRIMLFPLNSWSIKSTMRMQEITPLLKVIDAKYKKDPKKANIEKMKLFKEKGANPLSGCLPILIQLPFLFGMFNLLRTTFDLRGVGFIPGWIDNLTSPDQLFSWSYPIFFIGTAFHLLPILLGIIMYIQSKMNMKLPEDKSKMTDQQKQQLIMSYLMPVLFTFLFYKAPSGLNLYFLFSMFLGILQQWFMNYRKKLCKTGKNS